MNKHLFPYQDRQLGQSKYLTPKEQALSIRALVRILLSNLREGETIPFGKNMVLILSNDNGSLRYRILAGDGRVFNCEVTSIDILNDKWGGDVLSKGIIELLPSLAPEYSHPLCQILERDPAVFRLQTKEGWVINDALCLLSGNVQYFA